MDDEYFLKYNTSIYKSCYGFLKWIQQNRILRGLKMKYVMSLSLSLSVSLSLSLACRLQKSISGIEYCDSRLV